MGNTGMGAGVMESAGEDYPIISGRVSTGVAGGGSGRGPVRSGGNNKQIEKGKGGKKKKRGSIVSSLKQIVFSLLFSLLLLKLPCFSFTCVVREGGCNVCLFVWVWCLFCWWCVLERGGRDFVILWCI